MHKYQCRKLFLKLTIENLIHEKCIKFVLQNWMLNIVFHTHWEENIIRYSCIMYIKILLRLIWYLSPGDAGLPTRCCSWIILERLRSLFSAASSCSAVNIGTGLLRLTCRLEAGEMMFETELKIFGVVNGDKTSRADGMLLQWKKYPNEIQYHNSLWINLLFISWI